MRRYRITLEGRVFHVEVKDDPRRDEVRVEVNGETFTVKVETVPMAAEIRTGETAASGALPSAAGTTTEGAVTSDSTVTAPLPGVIKSIVARPGQEVTAGDRLFVIKAMKMDNVVRAPRAGTVATVHVSEGRQVAHGDRLLEFAD